MTVRRPVRLDDSLKETSPVNAISLALNISLRSVSQATLTLPESSEPVKNHEFFNIYTSKGLLGVFRMTTVNLSNAQGRVYTLTHAIDTLRDDLWEEQSTYEGTRQGFLTALFGFQERQYWQLGVVEDGDAAYKSPNINYTKLSDLLGKFLTDNIDFYPEYDFSTSPWTVNIRRLPSEIKGRFSLTRNARTCRIVYDDKNMCNCLYLSVNTPEKVNGITKYTSELRIYENAESIAEYRKIKKTASVKLDEITGGDADAWAADFFKKYAQPEASVTVDGYEIWKQTGEVYDEATVGKRASVHLPEHGITTVQRIESVQYPDLIKQPTAIVVSLSTKQKTFTQALANLETEVGKVGGIAGGLSLSSANAEEVTNWIIFRQKIDEAVNETGIVTLWESGIIVDAVEGTTIYSLEQGFVSTFSALKVASDKITANAKAIELKADIILLNGLVKASELEAAVAEIQYQQSQVVESLRIEGATVQATQLIAASFKFGDSAVAKKALKMGSITFDTTPLMPSTHSGDLSHSHNISVDNDGTVRLGEAQETGGFFKIADTKAYKDGVSAAYSAGWAAARAEIRRVTLTVDNEKQISIRGPSSTVDSSAEFYRIKLTNEITYHNNSAAGKVTANATAKTWINNSEAISKQASSTIDINAGMLG